MSETPMRAGPQVRRAGAEVHEILSEIGLGDQVEELERAWAVQVDNLP